MSNSIPTHRAVWRNSQRQEAKQKSKAMLQGSFEVIHDSGQHPDTSETVAVKRRFLFSSTRADWGIRLSCPSVNMKMIFDPLSIYPASPYRVHQPDSSTTLAHDSAGVAGNFTVASDTATIWEKGNKGL